MSFTQVRRRRTREGFLSKLQAHGDDFRLFHREAHRATQRCAKAVLKDFDSKAKKDNKEVERAQRERLKALRESNIDEYMKLIKVKPCML